MKNALIAELRTNRELSKSAMALYSRAKREAAIAEVNDKVYSGTISENTEGLKVRASELEARRDELWEDERDIVAKLCVCIAVTADTEYRDDIVDDLYKTMIVEGVSRKELPEEMKSALVDYVNIHVVELVANL